MATKRKNTVDHRDRKNKGSREAYRERKHEDNAKRGRQEYDFGRKEWVR